MSETVTHVYTVKVNRDDTVRVVAGEVVRSTALNYMVKGPGPDTEDAYAFGYAMGLQRVGKSTACTTPRAALARYMERRQEDKRRALSVAGQATKQIASANELLMKEPVESAPAVDAVGQRHEA